MNFEQAMQILQSSLTFGIRPGLERILRLLDFFGRPQDQLRVIHLAGTNGKGSVSAYCAHILAAADYRTGWFTSPYLTRFTERMRILDGRRGLADFERDATCAEISQSEFAALMHEAVQHLEQVRAEGLDQPTEFELITALALTWFARKKTELVVLETGLGGRLDSTNVFAAPERVILTAIGYDHQDRLGAELEQIAAEKAGIIKQGSPVFLYNPADAYLTGQEAAAIEQVIRARCQAQQATLHLVGSADWRLTAQHLSGQHFIDLKDQQALRTTLLAPYQPTHALLAKRALAGLAGPREIAEGIARTRWPARLERLSAHPPILLDGAHNPAGASGLRVALDTYFPEQDLVFVCGVLQDKDYARMFETLFQEPGFRTVAFICTEPDNPRALPAGELARVVARHFPDLSKTAACTYNDATQVEVLPQIRTAVQRGFQLAQEKGVPLCVFGSLYLAGEARECLRKLLQRDGIGS